MESANYEPKKKKKISQEIWKCKISTFFNLNFVFFSLVFPVLAALHCNENEKKKIYNDLIPYINTIKYIILFLVYSLHVFCHVLLVYIVYSTVFIYCFLSILHFCFPQCFPFSVNNLNSGDWFNLNDKKDSLLACLATNVINFRFLFTSLSIDNPFMTSKWEGTIY